MDIRCLPSRNSWRAFPPCLLAALTIALAWQSGQSNPWGSPPDRLLAQQPGRPIDDQANTQAETTPRLTPRQAARSIQLPDGFQAELFAAEPQVQQPIAMTLDARGRLWIAENYTYAERAVNYDLRYRDRIVILEDADRDGQADRRTVFWDGAERLTSVEVGFGGVWALCPPYLLFLPDRDGDDVPDGEPVVMLDGWDASDARHNFVNGLRWGPDGWLYGRNGILATSRVGVPGCSDSERVAMNCGIWRFHPTRRQFEVVCSGTTNPWGHDWDPFGQLFFINTVIGHLWHGLPGAHYERMYGEDLRPYVYELIPQTADHYHWDRANETWSDVRQAGVTEASSRFGGGHAHSGLLIYQGANWPREYRGDVYAVNLHGRRVNRDRLERSGATYAGRHRPDFLQSGDPWFRGLDLRSGPDGGVFLIDWSDIGECHENDGVHRTSGRVYKITYGTATQPAIRDVAALPPAGLVALQQNEDDWFARQARLQLQMRHAAGEDLGAAATELRRMFDAAQRETHRLRALWCLHALDQTPEAWLIARLSDPSEHVRLWAIQFLVEQRPASAATAAALAAAAERETSGLVLTYHASALQRLALPDRPALAARLLAQTRPGQEALAQDPVLPLMIWYGIEPVVAHLGHSLDPLLQASGMPRVDRLIAQRVAADYDRQGPAVELLVRRASETRSADQRLAILQGLAAGLRGWLRAEPPENWETLQEVVRKQGPAAAEEPLRELAVVFGDGRATDELRKLVADGSQPLESRKNALRTLAEVRAEGLAPLAESLLTNRELGAAAVLALASDTRPETARLLLDKYSSMRDPARFAVLQTLAARPESALQMLQAVEQGQLDRQDVGSFLIRQMQLLDVAEINAKIERLWPELRLIAGDKLKQIAVYRRKLGDPHAAPADSGQGKLVFDQVCGKCHKLFGQGGATGPELTGAQRTNVNYWLENVLDPSADVATSYRMSIVALEDGRVLNGVLGGETGRTVTLLTPQEKLTIDRQTIEQIRSSQLSLMPEGLLANLTDQQLRDLFAYLMAPAPPVAPGTGGP